jgi:D-alanyl-D-alanine carboxypeptidase
MRVNFSIVSAALYAALIGGAACLPVSLTAQPAMHAPLVDAPHIDTSLIDAAVGEWLTGTGAPSVSIAIVQQGKLQYAKGYGFAQLNPTVPATTATRYAIDSVSKQFTAAAILLLAEQGKLRLSDPLSRWFPGLGDAGSVTLRQVLTHTSGIRDYWPQDFLPPEMQHAATTAAIVEEWAKRPLDFSPGTDWQYSNTGYLLAAEVVRRVSGESLFEFQRRHIFIPLHMTRAAEYLPSAAAEDAAPYTRYGLGATRPAPPEGAGWLVGAAGLAMTPSDLAAWDVSLIDRSLLRKDTYAQAFDPVTLQDGTQRDYGLGLSVEQVQGRRRIGHSGSGSGFRSDNRIWPEDGTAIAVLTNSDWASPSDLLDRLAFLVLPPTPSEARARAVFEGLRGGTVDRDLFTASGNSYLTAAVLGDMKSSLGPLGPARLIELEKESQRGGMVTREWKILCSGARLQAVERGYPGGRLEQFMVFRRED